MKVWQLMTESRESGSPYIASEEEAYYYLDIFGKFHLQHIADKWQDTLLYNLPHTDIARLIFNGQEFWIFTEQALQVLMPLIEKKAELLPLIHQKNIHLKIPYITQIIHRKAYKPLINQAHPEPHFLANIMDIKTIGVIDFEQSEFEFDENTKAIFMIDQLAFHTDSITESHLFKIVECGNVLKTRTFVSDTFRQVVEENQLTGLKFIEKHEEDGGNLVFFKKNRLQTDNICRIKGM